MRWNLKEAGGKNPEIQKVTDEMKREFQFILAGMTPWDIEWQEKALDQILTETGGWKVNAMMGPEIASWVMTY